MMKTKRFMLALLLASSVYAIPFSAFHSPSSLGIMAQNKQFTLEDLNFGGNNYRNMIPSSKYYTWWGDQLVRYDVEECFLVDKNKGTESVLLDTAMVNDIIRSYGQDIGQVRHMYNVTFPEAKKTLAQVNTGRRNVLLDWKTKQVVWVEKQVQGQSVGLLPSFESIGIAERKQPICR